VSSLTIFIGLALWLVVPNFEDEDEDGFAKPEHQKLTFTSLLKVPNYFNLKCQKISQMPFLGFFLNLAFYSLFLKCQRVSFKKVPYHYCYTVAHLNYFNTLIPISHVFT
jgi:hypothetical protein